MPQRHKAYRRDEDIGDRDLTVVVGPHPKVVGGELCEAPHITASSAFDELRVER
jgi:hypothetical protein